MNDNSINIENPSSSNVLEIISDKNCHDSFVNNTKNKSNFADRKTNVLNKSSFTSSLFELSDEYKISNQIDRNYIMEEENFNRVQRRHSLSVPKSPMFKEEYKGHFSLSKIQNCQKSFSLFKLNALNLKDKAIKSDLNKESSIINTYNNLSLNIEIRNDDTKRRFLSNEENNFIRRSSLRCSNKKTNLESKLFFEKCKNSLIPINGFLNKKYSSNLSLPSEKDDSQLPINKNDNEGKRRRSAVNFNVIVEFNSDLSRLEAIHNINSLVENVSEAPKKDKVGAEIFYNKLRSKSLSSALDKNNYENIKINQNEFRKHNKHNRLSIPEIRNNNYFNVFMDNFRSESVDSGFSCASYTSNSSNSSIEPTERVRSRFKSISISSNYKTNERIDYITWIRSIKKLVQLNKELQNLSSETVENKEKKKLTEMSALRQIENVCN